MMAETDPIYSNLSQSQSEAMEKLRIIFDEIFEKSSEFESYNKSFVLYRFLKARQWDANKAEKMLETCIKWRTENNLKEYQPPEILQKYLHNMCIGNDKEGCPVMYVPLGKVDVKGFVNSTEPFDVIKTLGRLIMEHELLFEQKCAEVKLWLNGALVILDFKGLSAATAFNKKGIELMVRVIKFVQDIFPERLKAVFLINAPTLLNISYRLIKSFLAQGTQEKISFFSEEMWREKLLELIEVDVLPAFMGGTRTDPDGNPLCKTIVMQMGTIDESYYLNQNRGSSLASVEGVNTVLVSRFSTKKIQLHVKDVDSVIEWEFEVKDGDIQFRLLHEETPDAMTPVVVLDKMDARDCVVTGMYNCEKCGNYYAEFDNSYSWLKSKEILYIFEIYPKGQDTETRRKKYSYSLP